MMKSMTAYAVSSIEADNRTITIEIRSYNSRNLDIVSRIPQGYSVYEDRIKELISQYVERGRLEIRIQTVTDLERSDLYELDETKVQSYVNALGQLKDQWKLDFEITPQLILSMGNVIKPAENHINTELISEALISCTHDTLKALDSMRRKEGDYLCNDMKQRLLCIEDKLNVIENIAKELPLIFQHRLKERIKILCAELMDIQHERIAQEAALIADRADITEEIIRMRSHLLQFRNIMDGPESSGRKLVFLLQEMLRELNTITSKAQHVEISHIIVDLKSEVEKMREQIQNIE
ncbi:MAG: YicC family protein [Desulfobacterales bacterium]|nr:YicC family protein [Desulfobacterales bacterium]